MFSSWSTSWPVDQSLNPSNSQGSSDLTGQQACPPTQRSKETSALDDLPLRRLRTGRSIFQKFIKIHYIWILRKTWHALGQDVLLHHCIKFAENPIMLKFWQLAKILNLFFQTCRKQKSEKSSPYNWSTWYASSLFQVWKKLMRSLGGVGSQHLKIVSLKKFIKNWIF